jgi:hypothetical protein
LDQRVSRQTADHYLYRSSTPAEPPRYAVPTAVSSVVEAKWIGSEWADP